MSKPYDTGFIIGRFQTYHKGHERLMDTALLLCDRVLILVGSAQESGTLRNPLNVATRMDMLREIYGNNPNVLIYALADLTHEGDVTTDWGKYLFKHVDTYIYKSPELMIYGDDERRSDWFEKDDLMHTTEVIVPRAKLPISATMMRDMMVKDDRREWMKWVNPKLHKMYDRIRSELMAVESYKNKGE